MNIDHDVIREARTGPVSPDRLTPETLSAAYARISRSPLSVPELRRISRNEVEKARKSNRAIVFDMGHSSIAEHAVFNLDVLDISRLAVEAVEHFRLCSYTEKSQRYVRLEGGFVLPGEIVLAGLEGPFREMVGRQNDLYRKLDEAIGEERLRSAGGPAAAGESAREDARYTLSLATETQLGMTLNARNLELMIRRCAAHPLREVRDFADGLHKAVIGAAPSLVRYVEPTAYDLEGAKRVREKTAPHAADRERKNGKREERDGNAALIAWTAGGDEKLAAWLLHSASRLSAEECLERAAAMSPGEREDLVRAALRDMRPHDAPPREFEHVELTFELVVSASCFAQLKRHRMATLTAQEYDPGLGVTVPPSVREAGMEEPFLSLIAETDGLYRRIVEEAPEAAPYILTNAHRKRVLLKVNARELYHMSRLREDRHAQWDIRETVAAMVRLARRALPLTFLLAAGKDRFDGLYRSLFPGKEDGP
jgi:flavin-dependent thymidylate synthase